MRFYGHGRGALIEADSKRQWNDWCRRTARVPKLREFAEAWVALMESRAQQFIQVRFTARSTMVAAGSQKLTDAQIREVILILGRVWYLGSSLRRWAMGVGLINRDD